MANKKSSFLSSLSSGFFLQQGEPFLKKVWFASGEEVDIEEALNARQRPGTKTATEFWTRGCEAFCEEHKLT